jgi:hypothetical protein
MQKLVRRRLQLLIREREHALQEQSSLALSREVVQGQGVQ